MQNAPYVQMCVYVLGEEGSLHRAFADVTLLNNHSASIRQAENGALSIRQPKDTQLIHFFPLCGAVKRAVSHRIDLEPVK